MKLFYRPIKESDGGAPEFVGLYALFTEDGQMLPQQVSSTMVSDVHDCTRLRVEFLVGKNIVVKGTE